jgi:hypothetical protein
MSRLIDEAGWADYYRSIGWEVNRLDKATWGPLLKAATNDRFRTFAHFPDLVIASPAGDVFMVDCAGGRPGYPFLPARLDKVNAHRRLEDVLEVPIWHAWATGHVAPLDRIESYGILGEKDPNGHYGDGKPFLLVPIEVTARAIEVAA